MTVVDDIDSTKSDGYGPFYVRLQNLPFAVCQKHIREFFHGLSVPNGGVSIHRGCAFVVFNNEHEAQLAVLMDKRFLSGKEVRVSNADLKDIRRTQMYDVRRKLMASVPECWTMMKYKKRIRPTLVKDGAGDIASKKFCPDEIEFPGNMDESCLKDEKFPGNVKESVLKDGKFSGWIDESLLKDEKFPEKVDESLLKDEKFPEKVNESVLKNGKFPGKANESCLVDDKFHGKVGESCWKNGKLSVKMDDSGFKDGKITRKVKYSLSKKTNEPVRKMTMKTIKPTPVITLSQFKLVYEGTVF